MEKMALLGMTAAWNKQRQQTIASMSNVCTSIKAKAARREFPLPSRTKE